MKTFLALGSVSLISRSSCLTAASTSSEDALLANVSGSGLTAVGRSALLNNTAGQRNAAFGYRKVTVERPLKVTGIDPDRAYGAAEIKAFKAEGRADVAGTYAKRWAAKEACSKALGTGLRMGIAWRDMGVGNLRTGQPVMHLTGWAAERLRAMTPPGHEAIVHVTLTDDHPWAQAFVVIEARPLAGAIPDHAAET